MAVNPDVWGVRAGRIIAADGTIVDEAKAYDNSDPNNPAKRVSLIGAYKEVEEITAMNAVSVPANSYASEVAVTFTRPIRQLWVAVLSDYQYGVGIRLLSPNGVLQDNSWNLSGQAAPGGSGSRYNFHLLYDESSTTRSPVPTQSVHTTFHNDDASNAATVTLILIGVAFS